MVDYLAAKIGIGEPVHRDPVGPSVRSPSQKTPFANSLSPQRSVNRRRQAPRTVGVGQLFAEGRRIRTFGFPAKLSSVDLRRFWKPVTRAERVWSPKKMNSS